MGLPPVRKPPLSCRLGWHDWYYYQHDHPENIWNQHTGIGIRVHGTGTFDFLHDRVCLKCERRENQITPYLAMREQHEQRQRERQQQAEALAER